MNTLAVYLYYVPYIEIGSQNRADEEIRYFISSFYMCLYFCVKWIEVLQYSTSNSYYYSSRVASTVVHTFLV
jgi:hypothetical protein